MPNIQSAAKRMRQNKTRYRENLNEKRRMRQAIKETYEYVTIGQEKQAREHAKTAQKAIDKAVKKGVIKKNTAARKKSRLMNRVEDAFGAQKTGAKTSGSKSSSGQKRASGSKSSGKSASGSSKKSGNTSAKQNTASQTKSSSNTKK